MGDGDRGGDGLHVRGWCGLAGGRDGRDGRGGRGGDGGGRGGDGAGGDAAGSHGGAVGLRAGQKLCGPEGAHHVDSVSTIYASSGASFGGSSIGVDAWGAGRSVFSVGPYRPSAAPLDNHHGILDVWASQNIPGYVSRGANTPTIALTEAQHAATKAVYRDWLFEQTGRRVGGSVN